MSLVRWGLAGAAASAVGGYFVVVQGAAKKKKQQELEMDLMLNSYIATDSAPGSSGGSCVVGSSPLLPTAAADRIGRSAGGSHGAPSRCEMRAEQ